MRHSNPPAIQQILYCVALTGALTLNGCLSLPAEDLTETASSSNSTVKATPTPSSIPAQSPRTPTSAPTPTPRTATSTPTPTPRAPGTIVTPTPAAVSTPTPTQSGGSTACTPGEKDSTGNYLPVVKMEILQIAPIGASEYRLDPQICDPDGTISRIQWYQNSNTGEVVSDRAQRTLLVSQLVPGSYEFTLYAYDNKNAQTIAYVQVFVPNDLTASEKLDGLSPQEIYKLEQDEIVHSPSKLPTRAHPRYLGTNAELAEFHAPLDQLSCGLNGKVPGLGDVFSVKTYWDTYTKGSSTCNGGTISNDPAKHPLLKCFFSTTCTWSDTNFFESLYLLRRLEGCISSGRSDCQYNAATIATLRKNIYSTGISYFKTTLDSKTCELTNTIEACTKTHKWNLGYGMYDLFSEVPVKIWSVFTDIFWDELTNTKTNANAASDFAMIKHQLDIVIDGWLKAQNTLHWVYSNGNNWSPVQARGLIAWAITFYYEDERAKKVLKSILDTLWLHRDYYLEEGYYLEGISYNNLSFDPIRDINRAIYTAFGKNLRSVKWDYLKKLSRFFLDYIGSDGFTVDFGDSWIKRGWGTMNPVYSMLIDEILRKAPLKSTPLLNCDLKEFFSNKYYEFGMGGGWGIEPAIARDFELMVSQCQELSTTAGTTRINFSPAGGNASLRVYMPGATTMAKSATGLRFKQADQTYLAIEATNSSFPHRELDFGSVIWSAYGVRYFSDWGYGKIFDKNDPYSLQKNMDFLPSGHNTLYVPEQMALDSAGNRIANTDMSQIWKVSGEMSSINLNGYNVIHLDGSKPYGAQNAAGLVQYFDRWITHIGSGNYIIVDSVKMKTGVLSRFQESFYSHYRGATDPVVGCNYNSDTSRMHIDVSKISSNVVEFVPTCNPLATSSTSNFIPESIARIYAIAREAGDFSVSASPISWINNSSQEDRRSLTRWIPQSAVNEDIRVFALISATSSAQLPNVELTKNARTCSAMSSSCFSVSINGQIRSFGLQLVGDRYQLSEIR